MVQANLYTENTTFYENTATNKGGAIFVDYGFFNLRNSTFFRNSAEDGGAVYVSWKSFKSTEFYNQFLDKALLNITFESNIAKNSGGALKLLFNFPESYRPIKSLNTFVDNQAFYDPDISEGRPKFFRFTLYNISASNTSLEVNLQYNYILK